MPDVVRLILDDHETFRRRFAELDGLRDEPEAAGVLWAGLAALLEMHASAEEEHFYPTLLARVEGSEDETRDAVSDHDEIREGIRRAAAAEVGSDDWWAGIEAAREANDEHLAEEERDDLPDFLRAVGWELREELGAKFRSFKEMHADGRGLSGEDKDADAYLAEHEHS
ncbi:MAG: hemerythrin domain-containing protein [Pseudonocardia sp.]